MNAIPDADEIAAIAAALSTVAPRANGNEQQVSNWKQIARIEAVTPLDA